MYLKSTVSVSDGEMICRHNDIDPRRESLLFLHGMGDSGEVFHEAFLQKDLQDFNIIAPDLLGYGESRSAADHVEDFTFEKQVARIYQLLDELGIEKVSLVGHSMGGDLGTLMCTIYDQGSVQSFVNAEGDLTEGDRFITDLAVKAHAEGDDFFKKWLYHDLVDILFKRERDKLVVSKEHYRKLIKHCSPKAFWASVEEIRFPTSSNVSLIPAVALSAIILISHL